MSNAHYVTVSDVVLWLHLKNLSRFRNYFVVHRITGTELLNMTNKVRRIA